MLLKSAVNKFTLNLTRGRVLFSKETLLLEIQTFLISLFYVRGGVLIGKRVLYCFPGDLVT